MLKPTRTALPVATKFEVPFRRLLRRSGRDGDRHPFGSGQGERDVGLRGRRLALAAKRRDWPKPRLLGDRLRVLERHAVVEAPFGAHPTACDGCYDEDDDHLKIYAAASRTSEGARGYLDSYVCAGPSENAYIARLGGLEALSRLNVKGG